jgi:uncharacterized protein (TIGR02757 family)
LKRSDRTRELKAALDKIEMTRPLNDPVRYVRRFRSRADAEIVGLLVSSVAYGRVDQIMRDAQTLLDILGNEPAKFVAAFTRRQAMKFDRFKHRFTRGTHIACLVHRLKHALRDYGSLHALFQEGWVGSCETRLAISHGGGKLRSYGCPGFCDDCVTSRRQSVQYLLPEPRNGSAAKRMCLYLRWMVRDTYPDVGVWNSFPKSALVIPLDTHVARIGRSFGLTERRSSDWMTAVEITDALRQLDPDDPLRYDYPLSHLGIDGGCRGRYHVATCCACGVREFCREIA